MRINDSRELSSQTCKAHVSQRSGNSSGCLTRLHTTDRYLRTRLARISLHSSSLKGLELTHQNGVVALVTKREARRAGDLRLAVVHTAKLCPVPIQAKRCAIGMSVRSGTSPRFGRRPYSFGFPPAPIPLWKLWHQKNISVM